MAVTGRSAAYSGPWPVAFVPCDRIEAKANSGVGGDPRRLGC
jgi:hypothetical protein